jgi:hypothetical protein
MAFGSNELFKELITYIDGKREHQENTGIMPMSHVFMSGILTGMVSTVVLVLIEPLRPRLTTSGSCCKRRSVKPGTEGPSARAGTSTGASDSADST